jgi:hypothetical protein
MGTALFGIVNERPSDARRDHGHAQASVFMALFEMPAVTAGIRRCYRKK